MGDKPLFEGGSEKVSSFTAAIEAAKVGGKHDDPTEEEMRKADEEVGYIHTEDVDPETLKGKTGSIFISKVITKRMYDGGKIILADEKDVKTIEVDKFVTNPASVGYKAQMTINLYDYESCQLSVMVNLPCYKEELEDAFLAARSIADMKLNVMVEEVKAIKRARESKMDK